MTDTREPSDIKQPVFDYQDFLERIDGDVDLMHEVMEIFLKDAPSLLNDLYTAIQRKDATAVERAAHTLKGAAANISAWRIQQLSQHVQQVLKKGDDEQLKPFIIDFKEGFEELERVLRGYLEKQ